MNLLKHMELFCRVVETGSFSAVAVEQNSSQSSVSRHIATLEDYLETRLLTRTTRALSLTADGKLYYAKARDILDASQEAQASVGKGRRKANGLLRMACPAVFARQQLVPRLQGFFQRHPEVQLELVMHDGLTDLAEEGIDMTFRIGELNDSSLVAQYLGLTSRLVVASPVYLQDNATPETPDDLIQHNCLVHTSLPQSAHWSFSFQGKIQSVHVKGNFKANNSEGVLAAVKAGIGIGLISSWQIQDEMESGSLIRLLQHYEPQPLPMYVVYPSRKFIPLKVKVMIAYLREVFELQPLLTAKHHAATIKPSP